MASLDDILTAVKNAVVAMNNISQTMTYIVGNSTFASISVTTLVSSQPGRIARVSITTAGTTTGNIYDANATGVTTKPIFTIPNTIGIIEVNLPVSSGVVVTPGTGQVVTVSYS